MDTDTSRLWTPAEVGKPVNRSGSTAKRVALELRIEPLRTQFGARLFTQEQAARITAEIQRRAQEDRR
jgi:hypothetical protein